MRPISGFSACAARSRMDDALAPLLAASPGSGPPGSPNLSSRVSGRVSRCRLLLFDDRVEALEERFRHRNLPPGRESGSLPPVFPPAGAGQHRMRGPVLDDLAHLGLLRDHVVVTEHVVQLLRGYGQDPRG